MSPETMPQPSACFDPETVDYDSIITQDDAPMDSVYCEIQQRLLSEALLSSWAGPGDGRPFVAMSNVGLFCHPKTPAIVPDMMLSVDVSLPADVRPKRNQSYFIWNYGKPPDVVIEVISFTDGDEKGGKMTRYARCGVLYYAIWDRDLILQDVPLELYVLKGDAYERTLDTSIPLVGLKLAAWRGTYQDNFNLWLRWCDHDGVLIPTGAESARREKARADEATEKLRIAGEGEAKAKDDAAKHEARAQRLLAQLQRAGLEPENGEHKAD